MACYAISDIHGRYDLLKDAVDTFIDLSKDQLILVGDYIDGDEHADSYKTLKYIYSLNQKYNVIVLKGNHEEWLLNWLFDYSSLNVKCYPDIYTIQDFLGEEQFSRIFARANKMEDGLTDMLYLLCKEAILEKDIELLNWLKELPMYYETEHEIFVHAGIDGKYWKETNDINDYLMARPNFFDFKKVIISGHTPTFQIVHNSHFHGIYKEKNHIFIDPCVKKYKHLNVLKIENQNYYEVRKGKVRVLK